MWYLLGSYCDIKNDRVLASIIGQSDPAGHAYQEALVNGFGDIGNPLQVYAFKAIDSQLYDANKCCLQNIQKEQPNVCIRPKSYVKNIFQRLSFFIGKLYGKIKKDDVILIYSLSLPTILSALLLRLYFRNKVCIIITDLPLYMSTNASLFYKILKRVENLGIILCLTRIKYYVLLSQYMREYIPIKNYQYTIVEGMYVDSKLNGHCKNNNVDSGERVVMYAGTLNRQYGILNLVHAFISINNEHYKLVICGSGDAAAEIEKISQHNDNIEYLGVQPRAEVLRLISNASLLVNPRTSEGEFTKYSFPSKTMEYFASGTPTLLYRLSGIPEEYYHYCFVVEELGVDALKHKLVEVLNLSNEQLKEKGQLARQFILEYKRPNVQCQKIYDLVSGL